MDGRIPTSSRVISPLQFSSMTSMTNGLDFGSTNLFPSLPPVEESTDGGMDGLPLNSSTKGKRCKVVNSDFQDIKAVQVLIEAAKVTLRQHGRLHIKVLIARIQENGYVNSSELGRLESILKIEADKPSSEILQCQPHWFAIKRNGSDIDGGEDQTKITKVPGRRHSVGKEANHKKYKKKYRGLKKLIKRLIFENVAIADEITRTDVKFQRAKVERKFLLKQFLEYQSMCHESAQAVKIAPPLPEVLPIPPVSQPPVIEPPPAKPKIPKVRVRKAASAKAKKEVDVPAPPKAEPVEETNVGEATDLPLDGAQSDPPLKPKRKKPGTAIKRRVQPIPVDSKGKPVFPIVLGGLTVHSLGDIVWDRPGFHSERYIWPVGFCSSRFYPSMKTPDKKCIYTCKILDGGYGPTFVMSPDDDSESSIEASSATACHCVVLKAINKARGKDATNTGSGPEFFGFSHPTIQYLLQSLPNARKCSKYQWVKFELPKGKNTGKLGSQMVAGDEPMDVGDEPMDVGDEKDQGSTNFDADEIFKDDSMDGSSSDAVHTLTLTSSAPNISQLPSPGFERGMLGYQLKSTSGDPSLDLGTPISPPSPSSPPQSSLSSPLQLSPKINTSAMSPSAATQPTFLIPSSSLALFSFEDTGLTD